MFTFPLQAFPAFGVVFSTFDGNDEVVKRNIGASIMTCLLGVVAYFSIDYLGNVVSLLGSLVGIPIALIYPRPPYSNVNKSQVSNTTTNEIDRFYLPDVLDE
jgi:amino acid permease